MEKLITYKKTKIEEETNEEFYLNPKDMINNDKIYENSSSFDLMTYLTFNELLIVLFAENIAIIDIKRTISKNFTIIKMININKLYDNNFKSIDEQKVKTLTSNEFALFCFKSKENDIKVLKNFVCFEVKNNLNSLYFIVEFLNLDLVIFKYNNVNIEDNYTVIYKQTKTFFVKDSKNFKLSYESNLILNYNTSIKYLEQISNKGSYYILYQIESYIYIFSLSDDQFSLIHIFYYGFEIKNFICDKYNNSLLFYSVSIINQVRKILYSIEKGKVLEESSINKELEGNITLIKFDKLYSKENNIILLARMNNILIFNIYNNHKLYHITFSLFEDWIISSCFIQFDNTLFIFNSNGDYAYNDLEDINKTNNFQKITNSDMNSLRISKQIYSIQQFQMKFGFFILSTQNPIRQQNESIVYFIPENTANKITMGILMNKQHNDNSSIFTFSISEYLIYQLRFENIVNYDGVLKLEEDLKEESIILNQRIRFYMQNIFDNYLQKNNEKKPSEKQFYPRTILEIFKKVNDIPPNLFKQYLKNPKYKCDFCEEEYDQFDIKSRGFYCKNKHETFSCCITQIPFNENFLQCPNCNLIYSNNYKICLICQQMLQSAIM